MHAETALWRMASFFDAPLADIDAALAEDPDWMLPHLMRAGFLLTLTEPALLGDALAALRRAQALAGHATERESMHLAAVQACAAGDWQAACAGWQRILDRHPRDLYALQWAHLFDFYRGDSAQLLARPARVLPEWDRADPLRPYLLGMHAFGLEECGVYDQAEAVGRQAVVGPAKVPWATHAVAHVMEMQGRFSDGQQWLRERQADWAEGNGFANHHWWHLALFHLEALDVAGALALYDDRLSSGHAAITLNRLDGAALLWRVHLLGFDVGRRWLDAGTGWDLSPAPAGASVFNDLHALLVLIGQQRMAQAGALVAAVQRSVRSGSASELATARDVGLPLLQGMLAFGHGDFVQALRLVAPLRAQLHRVGGSHAQRDLVAQTLLAASARAGNAELFEALMDERRNKSATPLTEHWLSSFPR